VHDGDTRLPVKAILLIVAGTAGGFVNFYLLFPVIPRYAQTGGASSLVAGLCTTAFIAATVLVQPVTTRLFPVAGYPRSLTGGALVLGLGALPMILSASPALIIGCAVVRGTGFGVFVVAAMATITSAMPASRRGLGASLFGAASGLAGIAGSPAGPWIASRYGFHAAFWIAALGPLLSVPAALAVDLPRPARIAAGRIAGAFRTHARPFLIELTCTAAFGVVFTFLPLVIATGRAWLVSGALLIQQLFAVTARWLAGPWGDRHGGERLLVPAIVLATAGLCGAVWTAQPVVLLAGMALFGLGFGALQTITFVAMLKRSPAAEADTSVSIVWNLAFDGGTGIGAACGGVILQFAGHELLFGISALAMLATLLAARTMIRPPGAGLPAGECTPRQASLSG
jgi:MFS family permease